MQNIEEFRKGMDACCEDVFYFVCTNMREIITRKEDYEYLTECGNYSRRLLKALNRHWEWLVVYKEELIMIPRPKWSRLDEKIKFRNKFKIEPLNEKEHPDLSMYTESFLAGYKAMIEYFIAYFNRKYFQTNNLTEVRLKKIHLKFLEIRGVKIDEDRLKKAETESDN